MKRERPDLLLRARSRLVHFLDSSDEALDERMVQSQTQPACSEEAPVDVEFRRMLEAEIEEERETASRLREWNERRSGRLGRGVYCVLCVAV